jgi:hypothetical protein
MRHFLRLPELLAGSVFGNRSVTTAFFVGLVLRIGFVVWVVIRFGYDGLLFGDSQVYIRLANTLAQHGVFSYDLTPPFHPWIFHPPGFIAVLAFFLRFFGSWHGWVMVQIFVASCIPILGAAVARAAGRGTRTVRVVAWALALEPVAVMQSGLLITEPLHIFFLLAALRVFLLIDGTSKMRAAWSGVLLGCATLIRAAVQPLALLWLVVFFVFRPRVRAYLFALMLFFLGFVFIIFPWVARNYSVAGTKSLASAGWVNLNADYGGSIIAVRDHVPFFVGEKQADEALARERKPGESDEQAARRLAIARIVHHPREVLVVQSLVTVAFFTHDAYLAFLQRYGLVPRFQQSFSPSLLLTEKGILKGVPLIVSHGGGWLLVPILGRVFWVLVFLFALRGSWRWWRSGDTRGALVLFAVTILSLYAVSSLIGFGVEARLRAPINALLFILAAEGLFRTARRTYAHP